MARSNSVISKYLKSFLAMQIGQVNYGFNYKYLLLILVSNLWEVLHCCVLTQNNVMAHKSLKTWTWSFISSISLG